MSLAPGSPGVRASSRRASSIHRPNHRPLGKSAEEGQTSWFKILEGLGNLMG